MKSGNVVEIDYVGEVNWKYKGESLISFKIDGKTLGQYGFWVDLTQVECLKIIDAPTWGKPR